MLCSSAVVRTGIVQLLFVLGVTGVCLGETWPFDLDSEGPDILWTTPDGISPDLPGYRLEYEITLLEARALWDSPFGEIVVTADVTEELPEEFRSATVILAGPPPLTMVDEYVRFPEEAEPPDPPVDPGFGAMVEIGLNGDGHAYVSVYDVLLDQVEYEFPPDSGLFITADLIGVRMVGTVSAAEGPAVIAAPATLDVDEGGQSQLTVRLSMSPTGTLTLSVVRESGDEDLTVVGEPAPQFTPENWDAPRNLTFAAANDADGENGTADFVIGGDGVGDASVQLRERETDCDGNGLADDQEYADGTLVDCNSNRIPDVCEPDTDADGRIDDCDSCPADPAKFEPGPCGCGEIEADVDADGVVDCQDQCLETAPGVEVGANGCPVDDCNDNGVDDQLDLQRGDSLDCDGDGLPDECQPDTDADGLIDPCDNCPDTKNADQLDTDGDGLGDACDDMPEGDPAPADPTSDDSDPADSDDDTPASDPTAPDTPRGEPGSDDLANDGDTSATPADQPDDAARQDDPAEPLPEDLLLLTMAGLCGAGALGWFPLIALGLAGLRLRSRMLRQ